MSRYSRYAIVISIAAVSGACASTGATPRPFPTPNAPAAAAGAPRPSPPSAMPRPAARGGTSTAGAAYEITGTALGLRGTPYRNGGADPAGFDCSGFVQWVFAQNGIRLPRDVEMQFADAGKKVNLNDLHAGDLIFFHTEGNGASHVGLAIGGDEFVHAPSSRGVVRIERYTTNYWRHRIVGVRRIADNK